MNWYKTSQKMIPIPEKTIDKIYDHYLNILKKIEQKLQSDEKSLKSEMKNEFISVSERSPYIKNGIIEGIRALFKSSNPPKVQFDEAQLFLDLSFLTFNYELIVSYHLNHDESSFLRGRSNARYNSITLYIEEGNAYDEQRTKGSLRHELEHLVLMNFERLVLKKDRTGQKRKQAYELRPDEIQAHCYHIAWDIFNEVKYDILNNFSKNKDKEQSRQFASRLLKEKIYNLFSKSEILQANPRLYKKYMSIVYGNFSNIWQKNIKNTAQEMSQ